MVVGKGLSGLVMALACAELLLHVAAISQPHLAFVLVDDLGFNDNWDRSSDLKNLSWPNMNKLTPEGIRLENYYTEALCTPTRGAFMTGRWPVRLGLQHGVITGGQDYGLPLDEVTIADKLKAAGYGTYAVGKWHLGCYNFNSTPTSRGFDYYYGYWNGAEDYYTHEVQSLLDLHDQNGSAYESVSTENGTYSTGLFAERVEAAVSYHLSTKPSKPMFLYVPMQNVHEPLEAPQAYIDKCSTIPNSDRKTFCAMALIADEAIGNLTSLLKTKLAGEDYVVVISGDNGGMPMAAGNNYPLRGHKAELWEGGIRNNALVWGSAVPTASRGTTYSGGLVHVVDWHATLAALGGSSLEGKVVDGMDMWSAITTNSKSKRTGFIVNYDPCSGHGSCSGAEYAIREGDWKLLVGVMNDTWYPVPTSDGPDRRLTMRSVVHTAAGDVWFDRTGSTNVTYLFNISADETEHTNLASDHPKIVKALQAKVQAIVGGDDYLAPCNIPGPDAAIADRPSCYDDDANFASVTAAHNAWYPWVDSSGR